MEVSSTLTDGVSVIEYSHCLDQIRGSEFERIVSQQLTAGIRNFMLVIEPHNTVNEEGLNSIIHAYQSVFRARGRIILVDVNNHVARIRNSRIGTIMGVYRNRETGMESFSHNGNQPPTP